LTVLPQAECFEAAL